MNNLVFDKNNMLVYAEQDNFSIKYIWDNNRNLLSIKRSDDTYEKFLRDKKGKLKEIKFSNGDWIKIKENGTQYSNYTKG